MTNKTISLLRSLFAKDEDGNVSLRVVINDKLGSSELKNAVSTQSSTSLEALVASSIVLDANNNPALRLSLVEYKISKFDFDQNEKVRAAKEIKKAKKVATEKRVKFAKAQAAKKQARVEQIKEAKTIKSTN